jgi:flagellar biogenesis protein FliO
MATPVRLRLVQLACAMLACGAVNFGGPLVRADAQSGAASGEIVRNSSLSEPAELPSHPASDWQPSHDLATPDPQPTERALAYRRDEQVIPAAAEQSIPSATSPPVTASLPGPQRPLPLAARSKSERAAHDRAGPTTPAESLITVGGSLCVVLSIFFGVAWLTRRGMPRKQVKLPGEVIEVLGKAPLVKGQDLQLVRIGAKLLLLNITPHGCETLTEITDPLEVDRLSAICRRDHPNSVSAAFHQVLHGMGREPASGFTGDPRTAGGHTPTYSATDRRGNRYHA